MSNIIKKNEIVSKSITNILEENYMPYSIYVILSRAIPSIDGFKPVHRRILYTMYKMHQFHDGRRTKSKDVVGQVMRLHPHADNPIYKAMKRMGRDDTFLIPLIDGKGDYGVNTSKEYVGADARYTEARLSKFAEELFRGIEDNAVNMIKDYNDDKEEPELLPVSYPSILINPNMGIAVGMACDIPSFNLTEVCYALENFIENEDINLLEYIPAPDFGTGGTILFKKESMERIYKTGKGRLRIRAKYRYNIEKNAIEIYEIPYTTNREIIMDEIRGMIKEGNIKSITNLKDLSDIKGLNITIYLKKNADYTKVMEELYVETKLEDVFSCNFNILINKRPRVMGIKDIFREWLKFRVECVRRESKFNLEKLSKKIHILKGVQSILVNIDKAIEIIRKTKKKQDVLNNLMVIFNLDQEQARAITKIELGNLNEEYILATEDEVVKMEDEINKLQNIINSDDCVKKEIKEQLKNIRENFPCKRRSEISYDYVDYKKEKKEDEKAVEVKEYDVNVYITKDGYIKKIPIANINNRSEFNIKEGDEIKEVFCGNNKNNILLFTDKGNSYSIKLYELKDEKMSSLGEFIPNIINLEEDENIVDIVLVDFEKDKDNIVIFYEDGRCNKIDIDAYNSRYSMLKGNDVSKVIKVDKLYIYENVEYLLLTEKGRALIIESEEIKETKNRKTMGIKGIKLREGDKLVSVITLPLHKNKLKLKTTKGVVELELLYNYFKGDVGNVGLPLYEKQGDNIIGVIE